MSRGKFRGFFVGVHLACPGTPDSSGSDMCHPSVCRINPAFPHGRDIVV